MCFIYRFYVKELYLYGDDLHRPIKIDTATLRRRYQDSRTNIIHLHENVKLFFIFLQDTPKSTAAVPSAGTD
jgi:hypothetical protein